MADDATPETTPAQDGRAHVDSSGRVKTEPGRRAWVWVEDSVTGHRYDVPASSLPVQGLTVVDGYEINYREHARTAKTRQQWQADDVEEVAAPSTGPAGVRSHAPVAETAVPETVGAGDDQVAAAAKKNTKEGRPAQ